MVGAGDVFLAGDRQRIGAREDGAALATRGAVEARGGPAERTQGRVDQDEFRRRKFLHERAHEAAAAEQPLARRPVERRQGAVGQNGADDVACGLAVRDRLVAEQGAHLDALGGNDLASGADPKVAMVGQVADLHAAGGIPCDDAPAVAGQADFVLREGLEERAIGAFGEQQRAQIGRRGARHVVERGEQQARHVVEGIDVGMGIEMDADGLHFVSSGKGGVSASTVQAGRANAKSRPRTAAMRAPPGTSSAPILSAAAMPLWPRSSSVRSK